MSFYFPQQIVNPWEECVHIEQQVGMTNLTSYLENIHKLVMIFKTGTIFYKASHFKIHKLFLFCFS